MDHHSDFEFSIRKSVSIANRNLHGDKTTPWEVVMEYLIDLEKRVAFIESKEPKSWWNREKEDGSPF